MESWLCRPGRAWTPRGTSAYASLHGATQEAASFLQTNVLTEKENIKRYERPHPSELTDEEK